VSYLVLARKYRPRSFEEVVGQATVTRTLQNALASGKIGHAFLLSGARGVGKTTTARLLAKALNCSAGEAPTPHPCDRCESCVEVGNAKSLDVQEIDGATHNGVEQVRELRESARYNPARDRFKIWIIDEVHMLSTGAFNALLKTLEEPPPRVKFIFATTEYHKLPDTILSRCQQYDFRMIPARDIQAHLREIAGREGIRVSDEALGRIAHAAEGSARDALSLFDQVLAFSGEQVRDEDLGALLGLVDRELLLAASRSVSAGDSLALLELVERLSDYGSDYRSFARELLLHFREILLLKLAPEASGLLSALTPEDRQKLAAAAVAYSEEDLLRAMDVLTEAILGLADKATQDPRVSLELALLKLAQLRRLEPFQELVERVERLAGGAPTPARAVVPDGGGSTPRVAQRQAVLSTADPRPAAAGAPPPATVPSPVPAPAEGSGDILAAMQGLTASRPSLSQPLRGARARLEDDTLVLEVGPDFASFASAHAGEYRELARQAAGRALKVRVAAAEEERPAEAAPPSPDEVRRERMMKEAAREPAVQEALDLFGGKIVGVREAEPPEPS
jgi:DNA polymerase-3 subunit gamma/tau